MTKVKECRGPQGSLYYGCNLRLGGSRLGYKLSPLEVNGVGNNTRVNFDSVHSRTAKEAVCFYNISLDAADIMDSQWSAPNCSGIALESASGDGGSGYEGADLSGPNNTTETSSCKSYVRAYYTTESGEESDVTVCLSDVAGFYSSLHNVTSLFVVYWTNNDPTNEGSSFRMRARCMG